MEGNVTEEQPDLGPYCLQYKLHKNINSKLHRNINRLGMQTINNRSLGEKEFCLS